MHRASQRRLRAVVKLQLEAAPLRAAAADGALHAGGNSASPCLTFGRAGAGLVCWQRLKLAALQPVLQLHGLAEAAALRGGAKEQATTVGHRQRQRRRSDLQRWQGRAAALRARRRLRAAGSVRQAQGCPGRDTRAQRLTFCLRAPPRGRSTSMLAHEPLQCVEARNRAVSEEEAGHPPSMAHDGVRHPLRGGATRDRHLHTLIAKRGGGRGAVGAVGAEAGAYRRCRRL